MSYYDSGYSDPTTNGPHLPDFSVWKGMSPQQIFCQTPISPLILAGAGVVGYFIAKGGMKWVSLIGGIGLAAAQVFICHSRI